ncbi:N-formylglutamate deformylase [Ferrovibrio terrae]|uniref:N-formylglutamate deformylase n=1 Tax=Ferrovibrio terrae TaxID=2594003 RepID=A0A516H2Z8_9PROT|nr:N-formylglutamate deformylase [Ferrovibrio terrae]QDO98147.1 N-formylglutamate deformylase [Ferrovibrio terrae]
MTDNAELFTLVPARSPLLVNIPHAGRRLSPGLAERLTPAGSLLADTDWHVERLYAFAADLGVGLMAATHSRYVVDLNRDPDGKPLYPGADNTELCPTDGFDGASLYQAGAAPDAAEVARRADAYWRPYHARLAAELEAIRSRHGYAILLDGHSIISEAPRFFDGRLPDLNLGTNEGRSCDPGLAAAAYGVLCDAPGFTSIHNGRFKGGYITRHYGRPAERVHALQLEKAQCCYMDEQNLEHWDPERAAPLIAVLRRLVDRLLHWTPARTSGA